MKENKTAILIFANSAEKEIVSKPFSSSSLFEVLNLQTIKIVKKTGLPYFHFNEDQQTGNNFGERFTNAIQSVYNSGYDTVISIGNDTPHLTTKHILKASEKLKTHQAVLGPSLDGGFYLIGLKQQQFNKDAFIKLPWQNSSLNKTISKTLGFKNNQIHYLEVLTDIDNASDIELILNSFKTISSKIKSILILFFPSLSQTDSYFNIGFKNFTLTKRRNKGSPAMLHL
jgi:glycosyltransferase A (GT-A) superfamily protein (DUF2064 family)